MTGHDAFLALDSDVTCGEQSRSEVAGIGTPQKSSYKAEGLRRNTSELFEPSDMQFRCIRLAGTADGRAAEISGEKSGRAGEPAVRPLRVLIVEDDAMVAAVLRDIVLEAGSEVVGTISSGLASVGAAGAIRPDIVIMDVGLPGMDGIDAAGIIRARFRTPVIFISGRDIQSEVSARLDDLNAVEMLQKPVDRAALCAALERLRRHSPTG
jgi:CheY-like chemotaxis protein